MGKKQMGTKEQLLDEVITIPSVSAACDKLRIPTPVLKSWLSTDKVFARMLAEHVEWAREQINDIADYQLIERIRQGDLSAIKHWQKYNDERYTPRKPALPEQDHGPVTRFIFETVPEFPLIPQEESVTFETVAEDGTIETTHDPDIARSRIYRLNRPG